ncbi:MAG: DegV family protein [Eggerthellaceae bacterium]|nr:DegV family protein [Eggerthellaceae bacterium]
MAIRIVSDSSSDLLALPDVDYCTVPLKIMFGSREYVDEAGTDVSKMMHDLQQHQGPSTTSCPNVAEWTDAFNGYDEIFAVTISSGLSASYEAAAAAKDAYCKINPSAKVHIFDSHATGPVLRLIIEKLRAGILAGKSYDDIKAEAIEYQKKIRILYSLESLGNLAKNGRVNMAVARIAEVLNIRMIGHASDEGKVDILHKVRGEKRALATIVKEMAARGCTGGTVFIDHCLNNNAANKLREMMEASFPGIAVHLESCGALCSYYADIGGLIIGYEVN